MIKLVKTEVRQATTILKVILAAATMSRSNIILWLTAPDEKPATLRLSRTTLQNVERVLEEESGIYIAVVDEREGEDGISDGSGSGVRNGKGKRKGNGKGKRKGKGNGKGKGGKRNRD